MTPARILANALKPVDPLQYGPLSIELGIPRQQIARAANGAQGQPTRAEYHLKLCAWLGVDPVTGTPATPRQRVSFDAPQFALAVKMARFLHLDDTRQAAKAMKISATVVARMQTAQDYSFDAMLRACRYGNLDPRNYVQPDVSRLTPTRNREAA